ncbi:MAG TPA: tRNA pseudouridine synthase A, partial [Flavisolibacter sp.]|nr:tRNA pseudouridine synthase A [Flavisolibacter sp.]
MARYFLEVAYKGTRFSGFQIQDNAPTIQAELEKALNTISGFNSRIVDEGDQEIKLTGSSRTDAGVHALQNYFHFDYAGLLHSQLLYKLNAVISKDIVIKHLFEMPPDAHARFDAISREYQYNIHQVKDPFRQDTSFYYPYKLDAIKLKEAAALIKEQNNFFAFAKTNSQVSN